MMKQMAGGFKRAAALMMSIFIILSQLAMPMAALALDVHALPSLNLYYPVGDGTQAVFVQPTLYANQPVYWATVPAEAMQSGVTLEILSTGMEGESYNPPSGTQLFAPDAGAVDGSQVAAYIEVFQNGGFLGSYPLYISTSGLPEEKPVLQPAAVKIECYDQNGNYLQGGEEMINPGEGREIYAPSIDGYSVDGPSSAWVEMYGDGSLSQSVVTFRYVKNIQPVQILIECYDQNDALIHSSEEWIAESRDFTAPDLNGYTLSSDYSVRVEMYEDGSVSRNVVTFRYQKIIEPVRVGIEGYDQNDVLIHSSEEWITESRDFTAPDLDDYTLNSDYTVRVEMYEDGSVSQNTVTFRYQKILQPAVVTVYGYDQNAQNIYTGEEWIEPGNGRDIVAPQIEGYSLSSDSPASVWVQMDENGALNTTVVEFFYNRVYAAVPVTVNYYNESGEWIGGYEDSVGKEGKTFYPETLEGYEPGTPESIAVTMDENGQLSQTEIVFYYTKAQPKTASITMKIVDSADWNNVFYTHTGDYTEGSYPFTPDKSYLPENYALDSEETVTVNVNANGEADIYEVVFTATYYAPEPEPPKTVSITVKIVDSADWNNVFYTHTGDYTEGSYPFTPDKSYLPENYALDSEETVTVNVNANGEADVYEVVFTATYHAPAQPEPEPPKAASITVKIVDSADWNNVFYTHTGDYTEGSYPFTPDKSYLPENYVLDSEETVTVNVNANGEADVYEVVFTATYHAPVQPEPEPPKTASITVKIVDSADWNSVFYTHTGDYTEGSYPFTPDKSYLPENYALDSEETVTVNVNANGEADIYEVVFTATYYAPVQPEPEPPKAASITVKIVDSADWNSVFYTYTGDYTEGSHTFTPDKSYLPENYKLDSEETITVNVNANGEADAYEVVFTATYHAPVQPEPEPPKTASITVKIVDSADWNNVFYTHTGDYTEGSYLFTPDKSYLPENYALDSEETVTVNVNANGEADVNEVVFTATCHAPEQPQPEQPSNGLPEGVTLLETLNCEGETTKGSLRFRSTPTTSTDGNIVFKGISKGVVVQVRNSVQNASGELWYGITHEGTECYVKGDCLKLLEQAIQPAAVTFLYQDVNGNPVMDAAEQTFEAGSHPTVPYFKEAPEGYIYQGVSHEQITVDANGANPAVVVFTYKAEEKQPVAAQVTFEYMCEGQPIIDPVVKTFEAGSYPVSDYQMTFEGYTFNGASREWIVIEADGSTADFSVTYDYNRNPVYADVTIHHKLADGSDVPGLASETKTLMENTYSVQEFIQYVEGYSYQYASAETIVVDANGANPAEITLTYQKNVIQAQVTVSVLDTENNAIPGMDSYAVTLGEGTHDVSIVKPADPTGYAYSHASHEQITVTAGGVDPASVAFYYQKLPVEAQVSFRFVDEQGNPVPGLDGYSATLAANTYDTAVYAATAPAGYQYNGASAAQIVIDENGASPAEVFFYYTKLPESVSIPVYHQDADGNPLMEATSLTFSMADFGRTVNVADVLNITAPEGYVYAGVSSDTITIDQRGGVTPEAIQVTYVVRPKAEADVTFHYLCDGKNIADSQTHRLTEGTWDTNEYAVKVEGYDLVGADAQTVTIGMDGSASPAEVNFTYQKRITTANLTVYYRNSFGEELTSPEVRVLEKGTHTITPNAAYAPAGYVLSANTQSYEVTVNDDLTISVPSVSFNYYDQNLTGTVTVNYYDTESGTTFATEELKLSPGTHELKPNEELVKSKGNYQASDILTNTTVKVDEKGAATPTAVVFYYKPATYQGYQGYLLTTQQTAVRKEAAAGGAVLALLDKDTVLWSGFQYQSGATEWFDAQTQTGESFRGWVDGAHVRKISAEEAQILIEEANQPKEPDQNPGYYITIMNNVPLRQYKNTASQAKYLNINTVVQVTGQEYDDSGDYLWHAATYYDYDNKVKYSGFIRDGQLRKLTQEEVDEYLSANDPVNPDDPGSNPYDPNGPSSYGYVTKDSVNFRSEPGGTRIKMLNKYGMALITGTREVNGVTWYNVNYSGQVGWIHGDYFHQMTLTEFTSFMGSEAYYQGIANNTASSSGSSVSGGSKPSTGNTGSATQGNVSSVEDWNVGVWQNTGVTNQTTYQPFNPYATPVATTNPKGSYTVTTADVKFHQMASDNSTAVTLPKDAQITIAGTVTANGKTWYQVTYDGRNGYVDAAAVLDKLGATPTPKPTSTFVIGTMIPITYDDQSTETQSGSVPWGLIGGAIVLVGGAGGVYAYALNQNKKRKAAAARAAASRRKAAAEAAAAAGATSPYARRAVAAAPNGQQRPAQQAQQRPVQPGSQSQYARPVSAQQNAASPYARPASAQQPMSMAQPQQTANPYARPAQPAPIVNPYAAPTQEAKPAPQQTANPYARPIAPISQQAASQPAESTNAAPRRTRMQRYHDANSDGGASTDA